MYSIFLWFNILSFTLLFAATGCSIMRQIQDSSTWLEKYIGYQIIWAFWLFLTTFIFFQHSFIDDPGETFYLIISWMRISFSFIIFNLLGQIAFEVNGKRWKIWQTVLSSAILIGMTLIHLRIAAIISLVILNVGYHLYLTVVTWWGFRTYTLKKMSEKKPFVENFLLLTSLYFFAFTLLNSVFLIIPKGWEQEISIVAIGLFSFSWALIDILRFVQDWKRDNDHSMLIPDTWGVTPREEEIVGKLLLGATNREISEELCISTRTVETHIYSIYRKCGVKNKIELLHKLKQGYV